MMCLLLSRGLSKVAPRGFHLARQGSAANHEIICRKRARLEIRTSGLRRRLAVWIGCGLFFFALFADRRSQNEDSFFSPFNQAAKRVQVRSPATLVASGFCKAPTHYPCFERRHDPISSPSELRSYGNNGAEVFSSRTAPSTGGASQWSSDSDSGVDAG